MQPWTHTEYSLVVRDMSVCATLKITPTSKIAVGLKIEIHEMHEMHEIHQNLRNPVSTNRNPLPTMKSNSAERKLNIEIQRKLQRNQRIPRKPRIPRHRTLPRFALSAKNNGLLANNYIGAN